MTRYLFAPLPLVAAVLAATVLATPARAAADPNGVWKWTFNANGQEIALALTLKLEGEKLTGEIARGDQSTPISDGAFKDDEVKFTVVRERNGNKITSTYKGKVEGDSLKGKIDFEFGGETRSIDWEAKREKK